MAKLIPLLGELSGSIGDNTFSHNRYGAYVRRRAIPTNPSTAPQQLARGRMAAVSAAWKALTELQQDAWESFAAANPWPNGYGKTVTLNGAAFYCAANSLRLHLGLGVLPNAPSAWTDGACMVTGVTWNTTVPTYTAAFSPSPCPANEFIEIWATQPLGLGKTYFKPWLRYIGYIDPTAGTPRALQAIYESRFGSIPAGATYSVGFRFRCINTATTAVAKPGAWHYQQLVAAVV